jgi:hypothetical protein
MNHPYFDPNAIDMIISYTPRTENDVNAFIKMSIVLNTFLQPQRLQECLNEVQMMWGAADHWEPVENLLVDAIVHYCSEVPIPDDIEYELRLDLHQMMLDRNIADQAVIWEDDIEDGTMTSVDLPDITEELTYTDILFELYKFVWIYEFNEFDF